MMHSDLSWRVPEDSRTDKTFVYALKPSVPSGTVLIYNYTWTAFLSLKFLFQFSEPHKSINKVTM